MPFAKENAEPVYLTQMKALLKRHPNATIIWAHMGLGRIVHPVRASVSAAERPDAARNHRNDARRPGSEPRELRHLVGRSGQVRGCEPPDDLRCREFLNRHADRILFGTDTVAPASADAYYAVFDLWAPVWRLLTPDASAKVRKGTYERIFNEGRRRVREWERANVK